MKSVLFSLIAFTLLIAYAPARGKLLASVRGLGLGVGIPFVAVATIMVNLITVPLGFGLAAVFPEEKFLWKPFRVWGVSVAWFFVPFWLSVAFITNI